MTMNAVKCSGEKCRLRLKCDLYTMPTDLVFQQWISPAYNKERDFCRNFRNEDTLQELRRRFRYSSKQTSPKHHNAI